MLTSHRRPNDVDCSDEMTAAARWDDRVLGIVMVILATPRVVLALATHETFGAEATIAAIAASLGLLLLVTTWRR